MNALVLTEMESYPKYQKYGLKSNNLSDIKIELLSSALNHRDLWIVKGQYAGIKYPIVLGSDGVGIYNNERVIINPGHYWGDNENVQSSNFKILGLPDNGTFSDNVFVSKKYIYEAPAHLNNEEAAALPLGGLTAYRALFSRAKARGNEKILIGGIGGGVALFILQFAMAAGLDIYVTSGSDEKISKAIQLGALGGSNYKNINWSKNLKSQSGEFDIIIDSAAGEGFKDYLKLIKPGGRIVIYGGTQGKIQDLSPQIIFWKQISIMGSTMGSDKDFKDMVDFVNQNKIKPIIDSVFDMKESDKAFQRMEEGKQFGKIVLVNQR